MPQLYRSSAFSPPKSGGGVNQAAFPGVWSYRKAVRPLLDSYIAQYGARLYGLCRALTGSAFEADDLYQETWLKALQAIHQYDSNRPFGPWITRICVNTYRSQLRRLSRSPFLAFRSTQALEDALQSAPTPGAEDYSDLQNAIDQLPEKLRLTVILFYFEDLDVAAAAQALHVPTGTVKSRLHKARAMLKEVLTHGDDLPF